MLRDSPAFSSFSVDDTEAAKRFYGETLGMKIADVAGMAGLLELTVAGSDGAGGGGGKVMIYGKPDHAAATFTVLNFRVGDIDESVDELTRRGVRFEVYEDGPVPTDAKGVMRDNPSIAWFKDPAGNILSVIENA